MTAEQQARDMLERMGVEDAQRFTAGDLVELANMIAGLAASQARELRLWETLVAVTDDLSGVIGEMCKDGESMPIIQRARADIALPADTSALREMIEAAKAEERGRVSRLVAAHIPQPSPLDSETTQGYYAALKDIAEGIAALPAITPSIRSGCAI